MINLFQILVFFFVLIFSVSAQQTVNVHFRVNTCAVPDTLGKNSVVQVRGNIAPLTWYGDSQVILTNLESNDEWESSDYWIGSAVFQTDTIIQYRIFTNHNDTVYSGAPWEHEGWEANLNDPTGNRILDLTGFTGTDTMLNLQFVNGWQDGIGQYATPYSTIDSTFVVCFRVNVQGFRLQGFNPTQHKLGIRGSNTDDWGQTGEISWGTTYLLTPENDHANGGSRQYDGDNFYSGAVHVPNQYLDDGVQWKFVVHYINNPLDEDWGNLYWNPQLEENVQFSHTSWKDTTFYWRWYDRFGNGPTCGGYDTIEVTFRTDMSLAINNHGFTHGDSVIVINSFSPPYDFNKSGILIREGMSNYYSVTDTLYVPLPWTLWSYYSYFLISDTVEYKEDFFNYLHPYGILSDYRVFDVPHNNNIVIDDDELSMTSNRRMPKFFNPDSLAQPITVIYTCDLCPAYYRILAGDTLIDIQGPRYVYDTDSLLAWGVHINGDATGGWQVWGRQQLVDDTTRLMHDDGTHGDEIAGDTVYPKIIQILLILLPIFNTICR